MEGGRVFFAAIQGSDDGTGRDRFGPQEQRFMGSAIRIQLCALVLAISGLDAGPASAQGVTYRWIEPDGGSFQSAANWTPEGVPKGGDLAVFDLLEAYAVSSGPQSSGGSLGNLLVTDSDLEFIMAGAVQNQFRADSVVVGSVSGPSSAFPGRLELRSTNSIPPFPGLLVDDLRIGSADFSGSKFTSGPGTRIEVQASVDLRRNATLAFLLGAEEPFASSSRVFISGDSKLPTFLEGTLDIGPDKNELPPIGSTTTLLRGDVPLFGQNGYPSLEVVVLRPTPGRSIEIDAAFPLQVGGATIESRIDFADTLSSIDLSEESSLGAAPTALEAADLDADDRDDLIVLLADGTVRIYPSSSSGG